MEEILKITKKPKKGDDGHKTFSIRVKDEVMERVDKIAAESNRARNDVINILLTYAMDRCEIVDKK